MTDQDSKIISKLAKIKAHAESAKEIGNEAEAEHFAAMLQQLLLRHKLEMTDLEYAKEMQSEPIIENHMPTTIRNNKRVYTAYPDVEVTSRQIGWVEQLAATVAEFNACRILIYGGSSKIGFVGHKSNVMITEYLFITLLRSADKLSSKAAMKMRREWRAKHGVGCTPPGYRESFLAGFIRRIYERLQSETASYSNNSMAIVRVNKEAVEVKNYMTKFKVSDKQTAMPRAYNVDGYYDGQKLANSISIKANAVTEAMPNAKLSE